MNKQEKNKVIDDLVVRIKENKNFFLVDTSTLTGIKVNNFRRDCFGKEVEMTVVKNTLLQKALEKLANPDFTPIYDTLVGNTAIMFCTKQANSPAKVIKKFRAENSKPTLKAAFIEDSVYIGDNQLDFLDALKSKDELIGDIIGLLQSPAKNVISALMSSSHKLSGIVKTLSEREEK
jgi:large subunit ribosomal protein L10